MSTMEENVTCPCGRAVDELWMVGVEQEADDVRCPSCVLEFGEVENLHRLETRIRQECQRRIGQLERLAGQVDEDSISGKNLWSFIMGMAAAGQLVCCDVINIALGGGFLGQILGSHLGRRVRGVSAKGSEAAGLVDGSLAKPGCKCPLMAFLGAPFQGPS